jgi:proline racemase
MLLRSIDLHAAGEPARVIISGMPEISGESMAEKRREFMKDFDHLRKLLLQEPRGYPCQNANVIFPSKIPDCLFGYIILEQNRIYPLMSGQRYHLSLSYESCMLGHNTICVVTALIQSGKIALATTGILFRLELLSLS